MTSPVFRNGLPLQTMLLEYRISLQEFIHARQVMLERRTLNKGGN